MSLTFELTDLRANSTFDLTAGKATIETLLDGMQAFTRENRQFWHIGHGGLSTLLDYNQGLRGVAFDVILGGTRDAAYNRLAMLERWLQQAIAAEQTDGARTWPVYLRVQMDSATNATLHKIAWAEIDTSQSLIHPVTIQAGATYPVYAATVIMALHPGRSERPVLLYNALRNGALERWNDDVDAPHGWAAYSTATLTRVADRALIGQYACKVTVSATGRGIQTDLATVPAYNLAIASAWISLDDSDAVWKLELLNTSSTVVASQTGISYSWLQSNAQQTHTDRNGNVWYLVKAEQASGSITSERSMRIRISETTNDATDSLWVGGAMIRTVRAITLPPSPDNPKGTAVSGFDGDAVDEDTTTINSNTSNYFEGSASHDVTFNTTVGLDGLYRTVLFDVDARGYDYTAQAWFKLVDTGGAQATVYLKDGAGNVLDSQAFDGEGGATDLATVATTSATGEDAATWYLLRLTGTNSAASGVYWELRPTDTGAGTDLNFLMSSVFIYRNDDVRFDNAFISDGLLYNRDDYDDSNPHRFSSFYLFNLPGDLPAEIDYDIFLTNYSGNPGGRILHMASFPAERYPPVALWDECENLSGNARVNWRPAAPARWTMNQALATASGGYAARFTSNATDLEDYIFQSLRPDELASYSSVPHNLYLRGKTSDAANTAVWFSILTNDGQTETTFDAAEWADDDVYEWLFLGTLNLAYVPAGTAFGASVQIRLNVTGDNADVIDLDALVFMPALDNHHAAWRFPWLEAYDHIGVYGSRRQTIRRQMDMPAIGGPPWTLAPGNIAHRVTLVQVNAADNVHVMADTAQVRVAIWPRTNNLLGTI